MRARLVALFVVTLAGCRDYKWPASMEQSPSVRPLTEARLSPAGSIPLGGVETLADRDDDAEMVPPSGFDVAAEAHGGAIFAIHCVACHGPQATGDGPVSTKFPPAPNLRHVSICKRTDGFLYGTLTAGGKAMPSMREGLTSRERWDLVAFVRALQREGCVGTIGVPEGGQQ